MVLRFPKVETLEQARLRAIVIEAKKLLTYPGIDWDSCRWDITEYGKPHPHERRRRVLYFSARRRSLSQIHTFYEQPFVDFAKAIVRIRASERGLGSSGHTHIMIALRYLYDALRQTGTADPTTLNRKTFALAMAAAKSQAKGWTVYHVGISLQMISDWMDDRALTLTGVGYRNPIPNPGHGDGLDPVSQAQGLLKMPSAAALNALADISSDPADDNERILVRIIDVLVIGGFRIGEVLSLPLDCWVEAPAFDGSGKVKPNPLDGKPSFRYGIRYWPEKGGFPYIKWLSDIAVPLARRAIADLRELCAEARTAAELLEKFPTRVSLRGSCGTNDLLDHKALINVLGLKTTSCVRQFINSIGVKPVARNRPNGKYAFTYQLDHIEKGLLKRRGAIEIVRKPGGHMQLLSQSLCVMFQRQFHKERPTFKYLPELIGVRQINDALGNGSAASVFVRRGLRESDGSPMRIKTNAFRHWLNTLLARGGLSDVELARWSGRRNIDQNAAYKHGTVEQRVSWARNMIKEGTLRGPAADTYNSINDPVEKEQFLETFVNVALFTPYGVCIHDYAIDPCPYHLNCLGGCSEYLRTKGDKDEQKNIEDVRGFHLVQLQRLKSATQNDAGPVRNYEAHCERIVQGATAALAVDDDTIPDGKLVKVFPKGKARGKALTNL